MKFFLISLSSSNLNKCRVVFHLQDASMSTNENKGKSTRSWYCTICNTAMYSLAPQIFPVFLQDLVYSNNTVQYLKVSRMLRTFQEVSLYRLNMSSFEI